MFFSFKCAYQCWQVVNVGVSLGSERGLTG